MAFQASDACPYERPFPEEFAACPAFDPMQFVPVDTQYRPLPTRLTCRHLEARSLPRGELKGFYAACRLGTVEDRLAWARRWQNERLEAVRRLSRELAVATGGVMREMWVAKGEQLRALRAQQGGDEAMARLADLGADYMRQAAAFFEGHRKECEGLGLPVDACVELISAVLNEWIERPSLEGGYTIPADLRDRFPPEVRVLVLPNG